MPTSSDSTSKRSSRPRGRLLVLVFLLGTSACWWDLQRPPARQLSARTLVSGVHFYQDHLRQLVTPHGSRCRFVPSCSRYAEACLEQHGAAQGVLLSVWRILRCGPWTPRDTVDPPPGVTIDAPCPET